MLAEALRGCDILFRANTIRFTYLYLHLPQILRGRAALVEWLEGYFQAIHEALSPTASRYYRFIQPRINHRIAITHYVARKTGETYGYPSRGVIPVGVDTHFFSPPQSRKNDVPNVLFIGHLIERKGPQHVIGAARCFPDARFVLVGKQEGDFYHRLRTMVGDWGLQNVTFEAPRDRDGLMRLMHTSDLLLHPSLSEGLPKVVLEGAATGLPAVIFNHYEAPAVLDGITGFQVGNFEELVDRVGMLINDRDLRLRMGAESVKHVRQFDWTVVVKQWEEVFHEVVAEHHGNDELCSEPRS
jgi:glycosyltransferase involved in cell wall biosynthesis